eukprot:CAMPEP_0195581964 /NCGR_PEP_ID=MMETSP0814-20130614/21304_1 /TAXON_ID=97485 /ORGANISM="Prymnesium parvum, Strain Texoma1" /LENGTH=40 /DNA_ID= /DNA_START= /DNA_END= /DNA_ORIENTATION=
MTGEKKWMASGAEGGVPVGALDTGGQQLTVLMECRLGVGD